MNDISIFSDIVSKLSKSDNCKYYEIYIQPLYPRNYESIEKEEKIEAIQISLNIQDDYSFNISEGRKFNKDDFIFEGGIIPVILGNNYTGRFCVGDSFTAEYLFDAYEFEVIGILQEHPGVDVINGVYSLDNRVIMPSFFIASDKYITDGIKIHYANKTSGKICTDNQNIAKVQKDINSVIRNTQAGTYSLYSTSINYNIKLLLVLMLSWAVMISLCHADMRLPGYLSWNVSFDGADLSAPSRKELVHTSMLCQHFKRRDDGTGICLFHSAVMPEAFLIPEEICQ